MFGLDFIAAGASALGSYLGAEKTNKSNEHINSQQMEFQERMSSTAYQRAVKDMEAAGLNPMLAYSEGGASTPPGSSIPAIDSISPAVSTALMASKLKQEIDVMKAQEKKLVQEESYTNALHNKAQVDAQVGMETAHKLNTERKILDTALPGLENMSEIEQTKYGEKMKYLRHFFDSIRGAGSARSLGK